MGFRLWTSLNLDSRVGFVGFAVSVVGSGVESCPFERKGLDDFGLWRCSLGMFRVQFRMLGLKCKTFGNV